MRGRSPLTMWHESQYRLRWFIVADSQNDFCTNSGEGLLCSSVNHVDYSHTLFSWDKMIFYFHSVFVWYMLVLVGPTSNGEGLLCSIVNHVWSHFVLVPNRNSHFLLSQTSHCCVRGKEMNEINQSINRMSSSQLSQHEHSFDSRAWFDWIESITHSSVCFRGFDSDPFLSLFGYACPLKKGICD